MIFIVSRNQCICSFQLQGILTKNKCKDVLINTLVICVLLVLKQLPVQATVGYLTPGNRQEEGAWCLNDLDRKICLCYYIFLLVL